MYMRCLFFVFVPCGPMLPCVPVCAAVCVYVCSGLWWAVLCFGLDKNCERVWTMPLHRPRNLIIFWGSIFPQLALLCSVGMFFYIFCHPEVTWCILSYLIPAVVLDTYRCTWHLPTNLMPADVFKYVPTYLSTYRHTWCLQSVVALLLARLRLRQVLITEVQLFKYVLLE